MAHSHSFFSTEAKKKEPINLNTRLNLLNRLQELIEKDPSMSSFEYARESVPRFMPDSTTFRHTRFKSCSEILILLIMLIFLGLLLYAALGLYKIAEKLCCKKNLPTTKLKSLNEVNEILDQLNWSREDIRKLTLPDFLDEVKKEIADIQGHFQSFQIKKEVQEHFIENSSIANMIASYLDPLSSTENVRRFQPS